MEFGGNTVGDGSFLNIAQGATLALTSGPSVTLTGAFQASGAGTVILTGGTVAIGVGGTTFDFQGSTFQWSGGAISTQLGTLNNKGIMNLSGPTEKVIDNDGTLDNSGTVIQTGSGIVRLHSDGQSPTIFKNEAGATYLIESDSGLEELSADKTELDNAGLVMKTAGSGTSTISVNGALGNPGTIEADSGTLALSGTMAQVSNNTLTGGTWNATSGATLAFPNGTNIATNAAQIALDGAGAIIAGLGSLSSNTGTAQPDQWRESNHSRRLLKRWQPDHRCRKHANGLRQLLTGGIRLTHSRHRNRTVGQHLRPARN